MNPTNHQLHLMSVKGTKSRSGSFGSPDSIKRTRFCKQCTKRIRTIEIAESVYNDFLDKNAELVQLKQTLREIMA